MSLRLGQRLCARIGLSLKTTDPFSLTWAISHRFRIAPMIGGFMGLNVRMRGTFSDFKAGIFNLKMSFLSTVEALCCCGLIILSGYPRFE